MRTALIALAALLPAACAHHHEIHEADLHRPRVVGVEIDETAPSPKPDAPTSSVPATAAKTFVVAERPDAAYERARAFAERTAPEGDVLEIPTPEGGLPYAELFGLVSREAKVSIRFETNSAVVKGKRAMFVGTPRVARDDLIAWLQDTCYYDGLVVVPYGPADRREYAVFDYANALVSSTPTWVSIDDLAALRDRVGLYVSCILTVPEGLDASRARQALSQLSTRTAGLGRVNEVEKDGGTLVVTDFANIVANMQRLLDEMAIQRHERAQ